MLYLSVVDWRWIKQRPQFLAEALNAYFDVHVLYPWKNRRQGLQPMTRAMVQLRPSFSLPTLGNRLRCMTAINKTLLRFQLWLALRWAKPQLVWLSHPLQWECFPKCFSGMLVYDCMDDYAAMQPNDVQRDHVLQLENALLKRADHVFASSQSLGRLLNQRHALPDTKLCVVRNGYAGDTEVFSPHTPRKDGVLRLGYFGTIGRWFDFELLRQSLDRFPQIEYHIWGPLEGGVSVPCWERLYWHGVLPHDQLGETAAQVDAFVMPFVANEIVQSVDPVKLYEYIRFRRNILCVFYEEIRRFEPFVMFYTGAASFCAAIEDLIEDARLRYETETARRFLQDSSWSSRAERVAARLQGNNEC